MNQRTRDDDPRREEEEESASPSQICFDPSRVQEMTKLFLAITQSLRQGERDKVDNDRKEKEQ